MTTLCVVCGDIAVTEQHGVLTCVDCAVFFEETFSKDLSYNCNYSHRCIIDCRLNKDDVCQYCKYMKCLLSGMKPTACAPPINTSPPKEPELIQQENSVIRQLLSTPSLSVRLNIAGKNGPDGPDELSQHCTPFVLLERLSPKKLSSPVKTELMSPDILSRQTPMVLLNRLDSQLTPSKLCSKVKTEAVDLQMLSHQTPVVLLDRLDHQLSPKKSSLQVETEPVDSQMLSHQTPVVLLDRLDHQLSPKKSSLQVKTEPADPNLFSQQTPVDLLNRLDSNHSPTKLCSKVKTEPVELNLLSRQMPVVLLDRLDSHLTPSKLCAKVKTEPESLGILDPHCTGEFHIEVINRREPEDLLALENITYDIIKKEPALTPVKSTGNTTEVINHITTANQVSSEPYLKSLTEAGSKFVPLSSQISTEPEILHTTEIMHAQVEGFKSVIRTSQSKGKQPVVLLERLDSTMLQAYYKELGKEPPVLKTKRRARSKKRKESVLDEYASTHRAKVSKRNLNTGHMEDKGVDKDNGSAVRNSDIKDQMMDIDPPQLEKQGPLPANSCQVNQSGLQTGPPQIDHITPRVDSSPVQSKAIKPVERTNLFSKFSAHEPSNVSSSSSPGQVKGQPTAIAMVHEPINVNIKLEIAEAKSVADFLFKCWICEKGFNKEVILKAHLIEHEEEFCSDNDSDSETVLPENSETGGPKIKSPEKGSLKESKTVVTVQENCPDIASRKESSTGAQKVLGCSDDVSLQTCKTGTQKNQCPDKISLKASARSSGKDSSEKVWDKATSIRAQKVLGSDNISHKKSNTGAQKIHGLDKSFPKGPSTGTLKGTCQDKVSLKASSTKTGEVCGTETVSHKDFSKGPCKSQCTDTEISNRPHDKEKPKAQESLPDNFICGICRKVFDTEKNLTIHLTIHRNTLPTQAPSPTFIEPIHPYICGICKKSFEKEKGLKMHFMLHEKELRDQNGISTVNVPEYVCGICTRSFESESILTSHIIAHNDVKSGGVVKENAYPYICGLCKKGFYIEINLTQHLLKHERKAERAKAKALAGLTTSTVSAKDKDTSNSDKSKMVKNTSKVPIFPKSDSIPPSKDRNVRNTKDPHYKPNSDSSDDDSDIDDPSYIPSKCKSKVAPEKRTRTVPDKQPSATEKQKADSTSEVETTSDKNYVCGLCKKGFISVLELKTHLISHAEIFQSCEEN